MKYKHIKFFIYNFFDKELNLFAASLSFYTLFSLIPFLAIVLTLITSLDSFSLYYEEIKSFIFSNLLPGNSHLLMDYIDGFLQNIAKIGTLGVSAILVSSLLFFRNFAYIANRIFHAKNRSIFASIGLYFLLITLMPLALGISFYISSHIAILVNSSSLSSTYNILIYLPYLIIWGAFFVIFQMAANTKIYPKASLMSSFLAAIIFSISKNIFIYYIFMNKLYTTIYGSFAIVIFLFLWIYISWVIFLYGLKLTHTINCIYKKRASAE